MEINGRGRSTRERKKASRDHNRRFDSSNIAAEKTERRQLNISKHVCSPLAAGKGSRHVTAGLYSRSSASDSP